jgi:hypothetical protein
MSIDVTQVAEDARKCIRRVSTGSARARLTAELESLLVQHARAPEAEKETIAVRIAQFRRDAEVAATVNLWSWASIALVGFAIVTFFGGIIAYMAFLGPTRYSSIEATRPVLVFTLIIAMLGFGGLLITRALFADAADDKFQNQFRHAREIFLVFAGIFGTIIGFYFGASDDENDTGPSVEVSYAGTQVTAAVSGGAGPFIGIFTPSGGTGGQVVRSSERALNFAGVAECPKDATVLVIDGTGKQTSGSVSCPAPGGTAGGNAQTAQENAADAENANEANAANAQQ